MEMILVQNKALSKASILVIGAMYCYLRNYCKSATTEKK